jgi:DNA-binding transcriptional LysR family regulator
VSKTNMNDLVAFLAVAREGNFTRAAARLGVSQSALSHTIRQAEERLGVRLLTRTTRAVSLTEAGERLLNGVAPHLDQVEAQVEALSALRDKPAGSIRIASSEYAISFILWPKLMPFLVEHPDIKVELYLDNGLTDIVNDRFDAGVRMGESLAKDMISARIGPDFRMAVVAAPGYFEGRETPTHPRDLVGHMCINFRLPSAGGMYAWEFEEDGRPFKVRVDGQVAFNNTFNSVEATLSGFGMAYVPEDFVTPHLEAGRLVRVLDEFCPVWDGFYLYYPSRRQASPAFVAMVEAIRHRR